jgi:hypothetical protein
MEISLQQFADWFRSHIDKQSANIDEYPYVSRGVFTRDREDEVGLGIRVQNGRLTSEKPRRKLRLIYLCNACGRNGIDADFRASRDVNGIEKRLIRVSETIDADVLGMESFLPGNGYDDGFFGVFSVTQIDDRSCLKRALSHLERLLS